MDYCTETCKGGPHFKMKGTQLPKTVGAMLSISTESERFINLTEAASVRAKCL